MRIQIDLFIPLSVIVLLSACNGSPSTTDNQVDSAAFNVEVYDTIPSKFTEIEGEYFVSFQDEPVVDSAVSEAKEVSASAAFEMRSNDAVLSPEGREKLKWLNRSKQGYAGRLSQSELELLRELSPNIVIKPNIRVQFFTNIPAPVSLPAEKIGWGVQRVTNATNNVQSSKRVWILDSGIDRDHEDLNVDKTLSYSTFPGKNYWDVSGNGNDHGTQVAGIIGAIVNSKGTVGVAPNVLLVAVKFIHDNYFSYPYYIEGLKYVLRNANPGDVLNLSLQRTPGWIEEKTLITRIAAKGVSVVIAAGNDFKDVDNDNGGYTPAMINAPNIYTVSAFEEVDRFTRFSNYGLSVDISAPGMAILTTLPGNRYGYNQGTSMSAPFVSGLLAKGQLKQTKQVTDDPDKQKDYIAHD